MGTVWRYIFPAMKVLLSCVPALWVGSPEPPLRPVCPRGLTLALLLVLAATGTQCENPNPREEAQADGVAGAAGAGGAGGAGGAAAGSAIFSVSSALSATIGTVGIVEWSVDVPVDSAYIDFGRDPDDYEYRAPVEAPRAGGNRTLLLGMKPDTTYSFQIVAEDDSASYSSDVYQITTEPVRNGLPTIDVETRNAARVDRGFTISCEYGPGSLQGSWVTILDGDGDYVWWYRSAELQNCSRARMSYDGSFMWVGNTNVRGGLGLLMRVPMDGSGHELFELPRRHHDFLVMPDETLVNIEYEADSSRGCDVITTFDVADESSSVFFEVQPVDPDADEECHSNAINWWPSRETFTLSVLNWDSILAFDAEGELQWVFGGNQTDYSGAEWSRQHQHQLLEDGLLIFNNEGSEGGSDVLEFSMSEGAAELVWSYSSEVASLTFGDARRLPNDNTLIAYSSSGLIQEITSEQELVREIATVPLGYVVRRASLYGPPPPFDD